VGLRQLRKTVLLWIRNEKPLKAIALRIACFDDALTGWKIIDVADVRLDRQGNEVAS